METKKLKHRKKQKKNKSGIDKGNADVLVVPPDILKKLGISIGGTNTHNKISNTFNTPQNTGTVNNESLAGIQTAKVNINTSESSILETASLMKKSVFLSPTFVPTVANMISGEVEISNVHNNDDTKILSGSFGEENITNRNVYCESISNHKEYQERLKNKDILELNVVINGVQNLNTEIFKNISKENEIHKQPGKNEAVMEIPKMNTNVDNKVSEQTSHNEESLEMEGYSDFMTSEVLNGSRSSEIVNGISNSEGSNDFIKTSNTSHNIDFSITCTTGKEETLSLGTNTNEIEARHADDNLNSLRKAEFSIDEAVISSDLERNRDVVKQNGVDPVFSSLKHTEIHVEQPRDENNISPLKEIQNDIFSLEGKAIQILQEGAQDFNSVIENSLCNKQDRTELIPIKPADLSQVVDNTIALRDIRHENDLVGVCDKNSVEDNELLTRQNKITSPQAKVNKTKEIWSEKEIVSFEDISKIGLGEKDDNAISSESIVDKLNQAGSKNSNRCLDEQSKVAQNKSENYLNNVVAKDITYNKLDLIEEVIDIAVEIMNDKTSFAQKSLESENVIEVQDCDYEQFDNNKIVLHDNDAMKKICNGSLKDTIGKDFDLISTETSSDIAVPVHKIVQKINIISEEIIPPSDLKDLRKAHSPIIKSLTPIPLNSIIIPKRSNDYTPEIKPVDKRTITTLPNQTEVLPSETYSSSTSSSPDHLASMCDIDTSKTCTEENVVTKENLNNAHSFHYFPLNKGDLKNNNDICSTFVIGASTVKLTEHLIPKDRNKCIPIVNEGVVTQNNCITSDLPKSQVNDIYCSLAAIIQDENMNDDQKLVINSDKEGVGRTSRPDDNSGKNCIKPDQESIANKRNSKDFLDKKKKKKRKVNELTVMNGRDVDDKEFCNNQINNIVKSSKENSGNNANLDKVKEIAEYIKKYAHVYKDNKLVVNKVEDKKGTINSKSNTIKSKLCIQGVEKPGGNKESKQVTAKIKVLKTYARQKKLYEPCTSKHLRANSDSVTCNVGHISETELNTINISMSCKSQDFCLCYDFGRLDASVYDNSYEHIHFMLHDDTADLESIFSIYHDEDIVIKDRAKLEDVIECDETETNTKTSNICWNYFHTDIETSHEMHSICSSSVDETIDNMTNTNHNGVEVTDKVADNSSKSPKVGVNDVHIADNLKQTDSNTKPVTDTCVINDGNSIYEVITIVEVVDSENVPLKVDGTDSIMTTYSIPKENLNSKSSQLLKAINKGAVDSIHKKQEDISDTDNKTDNDKQETCKSDTVEAMKNDTSRSEPESSSQGRRKRSLPDDDTHQEPYPKKNVKCGVCNKLFMESEWNKHVANKHNYIAWKTGQIFNFDDPDLIKKLREKFETIGSLKCPNCHTQTRKFDKFIGHIKTCIKQKDCSSRRASKDLVTCGVCHQKLQYLTWNEHIGKEHNYLAWIEGQEVLNIEDEAAVAKHLQNIIKSNGSLVCYKCGLNRKRVKLYLTHIETCDGSENQLDNSSMNADLDSTTIEEDNISSVSDKKTIRCGVCKEEVSVSEWTEHIGREHNYLAWEDGLIPLNLNDEEIVRNHLQEFIRHSGGLRCYKCGLNRRRVKLYLSHIKTCDGEGVNLDESALENVSINQNTSDEKIFECGVCQAKVAIMDWNEHIGREHNYLAWKVGDTPLDVSDEDAVKEHLLDIIRKYEGLICYKCGLNRRRVKLYLSHIKTCDGNENQWDQSTTSNLDSTANSTQIEISIDGTERVVKCGVCDQDISVALWVKHIGREHKYLAWQQGQEPLDLENDEVVKAHLLNISRENNGLTCNLCHVTKKYPKSFMQHVKDCNGVTNPEDCKIRIEPEISSFDISDVKTDTVICGVCNKVVVTAEWMKHMEDDHDYMGWLQGRPPLDLEDPAAIQRHLIEVSRCTGGLKCKNCGLVRKYAKSYLQHIDQCRVMGKDAVTCAVCSEVVEPTDWRDHAMKKHYNVAWLVGATPIEINNPYGVEPYIKEYQQRHNNKLVCKTCGISRVSAVGFYAHIITCGKTDEETEIYKSMCNICNSKYLRIYKSQHMTMHREKEYAMERKLLIAKEKELKKEEDEPVEIVGGRRKAAEKAKTVIEKYTSNIGDASNCAKCGFSSDVESEMLNHVCVETLYEASESDGSVDIDYSSEEDDDTDVDSNISDEEREARDREQPKSKKHGDSSSAYRVQRFPFQVKNLNNYMRRSAEEFAALHLTDDDIFKQYRTLEYEIVTEADLSNYLPPVEESCKVRYSEDDTWITYKRFEARMEKDIITLFTGASIQSMAWVPPYVADHDMAPVQDYLSVLSSLAPDTPRHFWYDKPAQMPALLQIWDCGNFASGVPELVMGLALDCGTIWSIDWCPSGARDVFDAGEESDNVRRLGLLAVASANGSAYVFAVPHPSRKKEKLQFCKLNPVVELRLAMNANRKVYQATAIKWSKQKGHAHIVVGYADGTTAYFDLRNESPMLKCTEGNVDVIYPYHDERAQNMCIEDVDVFPTVERRQGAGVVVAGSVGGAGSRQLHAHAAATRVLFPPHWPAALLAGDDNLVSQAINELEWYGVGRRVGGARAAGGCAWCGRLAASAAPLVRLMRMHPAYNELQRQVIAILQMVPFGSKRKRKNDELSMIMEPLTYDDTVQKYGIELKQVTAKDKNTQQKLSGIPREAFPERYPLADVVSMAFCPSYKNHHKLAMATHAGLIFILNV